MNNGYELRELLSSPQVNGLAGMEKGMTGFQAPVAGGNTGYKFPLVLDTKNPQLCAKC